MTTTETPAATIQRAATRLREHAMAVASTCPAPWVVGGGAIVISSVTAVPLPAYPLPDVTTAATYVAAMHPGVATAPADWLEAESRRLATTVHPGWQETVGGAPLAVAHAILREA